MASSSPSSPAAARFVGWLAGTQIDTSMVGSVQAGFCRDPAYFGSQPKVTSTPAVSTTQNSDSGRKTFQPRRISWS